MTARVLAILLAVSVGLNLLAGWAYLGQRDQAVASGVRQGQATATALQCSEGTEKLEQQAQARQQAAQPKIDAAADAARRRQEEAIRILSMPPSTPGDACRSADDRVADWWSRRSNL
jgi:uncharacterized protein HemX